MDLVAVLLVLCFGILAATEEALLVVTVVVDGRVGPVAGGAFLHHRLAHGGLRVHHRVVFATAFRVGAATGARLFGIETQILAARAQRGAVETFRAGGDGRIPVEVDRTVALADAHLVARLGALATQLVLDAQLGETVGEVADGLVVVEVGLLHPAFRLAAGDLEPEFAKLVLLAFDGEVDRSAVLVGGTAATAARLQRLDDDACLLLGLLALGDLVTHVGDHVGQGEIELLQSLVRGGGDDEHLHAHLFEFGLDEFGELLGLRHVGLVEDDDARTFRDRDRAERQLQRARVFGELMLQRLIVAHRVAAVLKRRAIDDVRDDLGAFDVAQEFEAQALALRGARNQARHVGDRVAAVAGDDHAEVRYKRGERVVGDLRLGGAHRGDEARLAGGRETHERHVGDGLEFEDHVAFLAELAEQGEAGGTAGAVRQRDVAEAAGAAFRGDETIALMAQVGELLARVLGDALRALGREDHGAARYGQDQILAFDAVLVVAQAHRAAGRHTVRHETIVQQAGRVTRRLEDDGAAVTAVAAVRAGQRLVLLTADAGRAVAAVTALDMDGHSIHKITHNC